MNVSAFVYLCETEKGNERERETERQRKRETKGDRKRETERDAKCISVVLCL